MERTADRARTGKGEEEDRAGAGPLDRTQGGGQQPGRAGARSPAAQATRGPPRFLGGRVRTSRGGGRQHPFLPAWQCLPGPALLPVLPCQCASARASDRQRPPMPTTCHHHLTPSIGAREDSRGAQGAASPSRGSHRRVSVSRILRDLPATLPLVRSRTRTREC